MDIKKEIGERFKSVRFTLFGVSGKQIEMAIFLSQKGYSASDQNVSDWEKGKSRLPDEVKYILQKEKNINSGWLVTGVGNMLLKENTSEVFEEEAEKGEEFAVDENDLIEIPIYNKKFEEMYQMLKELTGKK